MEAIEGNHVEGAVLWLARSILASLLLGKLAAWLRQVGLADDAEKLRSEIERVEAVVGAVKGRAAGNRPLARSLGRLKELLYDADDLVDELDYRRLQHQVEGVTVVPAIELEGADGDGAEQVDASRDNAGLPSSSAWKGRSTAWKDFDVTLGVDGKPATAKCIHCHQVLGCKTNIGTSVLRNHIKSESCRRKRPAIEQIPNPSSFIDAAAPNGATVATSDSDSRKRMRTGEVSAHGTATNVHPWNKNEFSSRVQQMARQLEEAISEILKLYVSDPVVCSNPYRSTTADARQRTSSVVQSNMYGRVDEKNSIMKLVTGEKSDSLTVLPIVGIGGIGKTALAQLIYNDPIVKNQFELRIWVWVSKNFDEVRLTREMLDFISQQKHERISSFAKLQEILIGCITSKRFLLILDDVWDDMNGYTWSKLFAPMQSDNMKGNLVLLTTRQLSVAKAIGTVEPIRLGALDNFNFGLLFKACAFGGDKNEGHPSLNIIGGQIQEKLHGNPLAAETAGMLLRGNLTVDHWSSILKKEAWKSLQASNGIMNALKLSYDELPYSLQRCLLHCSIFPNSHKFLSNELVFIWISQGLVKCDDSTKRLEDIGREYLTDLVNSGFFQQVGRQALTPGNQTRYVMPALIHDFVRLVSRTECAVIDSLECNKMLPTIRHLSIVTDSKDQRGNILREKLRSIVTSVRKLRTLLLIGKYDDSFFLLFQDIFQKAQCLRMLQISGTFADKDFFLCNLENSTHLRYLKLETKGIGEASPVPLNKSYHLQVLDVGHPTILNSMNALVNMRALDVKRGAPFTDQNSVCFEITQLQSMNELVQLGVFQLKNVSGAEASGAKLRDKKHLEKLQLSWNNTLSQDEYCTNTESEEERLATDDDDSGSESFIDEEIEENPTNGNFINTAKEVLEGLQPHHNLKHLQVSGYSGATSPAWLGTSVTCLQTLHLEDCEGWQILPSMGRLPFLTKLKLRNMQKVTEVSVPSLEELVLIEMPNLERCSCLSVRELNSSLRVLKIERCCVLEAFPLFESCEKLKIEYKSWLSCLNEFTVCGCPRLKVSNPLPPSSKACALCVSGVSTLPTMLVSSDGLRVRLFSVSDKGWVFLDSHSEVLTEQSNVVLSFHNLRAITHLEIVRCLNLSSILPKGLRQLICLKRLTISQSKSLPPSDVQLEDDEGMDDVNFSALPSLELLHIFSSEITGKPLSVLLKHVGTLEELRLYNCRQIKWLSIEGEESCLPDLTSGPGASSPPDEFLRIPPHLIPSLKRMYLGWCGGLTFLSKKGFSGFTSLEELEIDNCPELISSMVHKDKNDYGVNGRWLYPHSLGRLTVNLSPGTLQPCILGNLNALKKLEVLSNRDLKYLQLHSCTALEELTIRFCGSLEALEGFQLLAGLRHLELSGCPRLNSLQLHSCTALEELIIHHCKSLEALEGFQSLGGLRKLIVYDCPGLPPYLERLLSQGYELCPRLERLQTDDTSFLTTSFCQHLTSCQYLKFFDSNATGLTDGQETALQLLTSLQKLYFKYCRSLEDLPLSLHILSSLKRLEIDSCWHLSRLPENGLPPSLEELEVSLCNNDLIEQCKGLATITTKPRVKIGWKYVN